MMNMNSNEHKEFRQELANSISHGFGLVLGIIAIPILTAMATLKGNPTAIVGTSIYGFGFLMVYTTSTLYHSVTHPKVKDLLNILDHISIFLLIAGSYTPFILAYYFNSLGITLLCIIWGLALLGIIFKIIWGYKYQVLSTIVYLLMGWLVVFFGRSFLLSMPLSCSILLGLGGLFYTIGVIFYLWEKWTYHHAIWHIFVLLGSITHYVAVLLTVMS
ncbi:MAG: hemolysin III family protein [Saprospiraceae bacterium]|nr:hemolysin III family protein [Saprospiraceae bacterium]